MINEKNFRQLDGGRLVDKASVIVDSDSSLTDLVLYTMALAAGSEYSFVSECSVATVLQGGGRILDQDRETELALNPGSSYAIDRGTSVHIQNTMQMDLIISFVNTPSNT